MDAFTKRELARYRSWAESISFRAKSFPDVPETQAIGRAATQLAVACRRALGEEIPTRDQRRSHTYPLDK